MEFGRPGNRPAAVTAGFAAALAVVTAIGLAAILGLAASIRLGPVLSAPEIRRGGFGPYGDPSLYHDLALSLVSGKGFQRAGRPVVFRGPGYPLFLAAAYASLGADAATSGSDWIRVRTAVRAIQALLDASVCAALALIAWTALSGSPPAIRGAGTLLAALFQALNPYTAHWARTLLTEPLSGFLLCWCVAALALGTHKGWRLAYASGGILAGLLILTRPEYLPWVAAVGALLIVAKFFPRRGPLRGNSAGNLAGPLAFILCAALLVAPWTIRNQGLFDRFIPVASGSAGELLFRGSFEGSHPWKGWTWFPPSILSGPAEEAETRGLYAAYLRAQTTGSAEIFETDAAFMDKALRRISERPAECARAWFANIPRLWYQKPLRMFADPEPAGGWLLVGLALAAAALALGGIKRLPLLIAASAPAYLSLLYLPLHIEARYSTPATPLVAALAAYALCRAAALIMKLVPKESDHGQ